MVAPAGKQDGSGAVQHDIIAQYQEEGAEDEWQVVPGRHKTVEVPATPDYVPQGATADMKTIMDMPDDTGQERNAKNQAYKNALVEYSNRNGWAQGVSGWSDAALNALLDGNLAASTQADRANTYITVTLDKSYPVPFNL